MNCTVWECENCNKQNHITDDKCQYCGKVYGYRKNKGSKICDMEGLKETKNKRYDGELGIPQVTVTLVNWIIDKFMSKEYLEYPELAKKYGKCCSWWNFTVTSDAVYVDGIAVYDSGVWRFVMPTKWVNELFEIMKVEEEKPRSTSGEIVMFNRQLTEEEWNKAFELGKERNSNK